MKRRLNRAYDHMTMSDDCTQRIEKALQQELEQKQQQPAVMTAAYTKLQSPGRKTGRIWGTAAAVVLLVMMISVGSVGLFLYLPRQRTPEPTEAKMPTRTETIPVTIDETIPVTIDETIPDDYYSIATDLSAAAVENAAMEIRQAFLTQDWYRLYSYLYNSLPSEEIPVGLSIDMADYMSLHEIRPEFLAAIEAESCSRMFCNYDDGISMGAEGQIWLGEIEGKIRIIAINDLFTGRVQYEYERVEDGTIRILHYGGSEENVMLPTRIEERFVSQLEDAFRDCQTAKTVTLSDEITRIGSQAFSGCSNLETVYVGAGVRSIGAGAFENCPNLKEVYFYGDAPAAEEDIFAGTKDVTIYYNEPMNGWTDRWQGCPAYPID